MQNKYTGLEGRYDQWKLELVNTNTSKHVNKHSLTTIIMLLWPAHTKAQCTYLTKCCVPNLKQHLLQHFYLSISQEEAQN
jgi:hypothetical protein